MALRKNTEETTANTTATANPGFEDEAGSEATKVSDKAPDVEAQEVVKTVSRTSAVVVASNNALANALRKGTGLDDSQNVIGIEMLESMGIGAFPRITVDQGGFSENKTKFLGQAIKIELLSWNYVTLITCAEKDDKDADKLIRSSYDHVKVSGDGCTVSEYLDKLRGMGYDKATSKKYVEIYANLLWTEKLGLVSAEDLKMVQLSVSPQSVSQWQRYLLESRMKAARGLQITNEVSIASERKTLNANTFGVMNFGAKLG